jgi:hypothetical protein
MSEILDRFISVNRVNHYKETLSYIITKKRDTILGILGIIIGLFSELPTPVTIFLIIILTILLWGLFKETMSIRKIFKEKHIPLMVLAGRNDDEYAAMVSDVLHAMKKYGFEKHSFEDDFNVHRTLSKYPNSYCLCSRDGSGDTISYLDIRLVSISRLDEEVSCCFGTKQTKKTQMNSCC